MKIEFSTQAFEKKSLNIRPVGAELFHADGWTEGRTDTTQLTVAFANLRTRLETTLCAHPVFVRSE